MNCEEVRGAISALLDGEPPGVAEGDLEEHLSGCTECRSWQERAHQLTRRVRLQGVVSTPRPTARLMEAVAQQRHPGRWRPGSMAAARMGLVMVAVTQLLLWVPVLLFGHDRGAPVHVAHEMGAFDVAVAIGFLVAARRPGRAMGMLSLVGAAAGLLVVTAAVDLVAGRSDVSDEAPHLLVVAGCLLLWRLATIAPPTWERPQTLSGAFGSAWPALTRRLVAGRQPAVFRNLPAGTVATGAGSVSLPVPGLAADHAAGPANRQPDEAVG